MGQGWVKYKWERPTLLSVSLRRLLLFSPGWLQLLLTGGTFQTRF